MVMVVLGPQFDRVNVVVVARAVRPLPWVCLRCWGLVLFPMHIQPIIENETGTGAGTVVIHSGSRVDERIEHHYRVGGILSLLGEQGARIHRAQLSFQSGHCAGHCGDANWQRWW